MKNYKSQIKRGKYIYSLYMYGDVQTEYSANSFIERVKKDGGKAIKVKVKDGYIVYCKTEIFTYKYDPEWCAPKATLRKFPWQ